MSAAPALVGASCVRCGAPHEVSGLLYTCTRCGGSLDLLYDYDALRRRFERSGRQGLNPMVLLSPVALSHEDDLFFELLSWKRERPAPRLGTILGAPKLTLLDETGLPSGSLKDRASLFTLMRARELGLRTVAAASTGNAAASLACLAARMDMEAVIFAPRAAPPAKLRQIQAHGARLYLVDGNYDRAYDLCLEAVAERGWYSRCTGHNPWCGEGKKTAALALADSLKSRIADFIFVPVGDGCILGGIHKGLADLQRMGWIDELPKLVAVQAEGSSAIADAWRDQREVTAVSADTVADSIAVDLPRDADKALRALRETEGFAITVTDDEILAAASDLARIEGVFAEPAGAASIAGLRRAAAEGLLPTGAETIALVTGHGLKDPGALAPLMQEPPVIASLKDLP